MPFLYFDMLVLTVQKLVACSTSTQIDDSHHIVLNWSQLAPRRSQTTQTITRNFIAPRHWPVVASTVLGTDLIFQNVDTY